MKTLRIRTWFCLVAIGVVGLCFARAADDAPPQDAPPATEPAAYHSPCSVVVSPDGKTIFAADSTAGSVIVVDAATSQPRTSIKLNGRPQHLALSADGRSLFVAEYDAGTVAVVNVADDTVSARVAVGRWPAALALAEKSGRLFVASQDDHTIAVIDTAASPPQCIARIPVIREPVALAVTADERRVVVANLLPNGVGTNPKLAAEVTIIDAEKQSVAGHVKLPPGSACVRGVCVSPDGKWAYVVHGLGRFNLPITQLERGWVNTFALSVIDIGQCSRVATMLLDDLTQGAADPHSIVCSKDGARVWITHSGVHEVSLVEIGRVHEYLAGKLPESLVALQDGSLPNIWVRIRQDPAQISELENDLTALYIGGAIRRFPTGGKGPRGLALSPDETKLYVANYYDGKIAVLETGEGRAAESIALGKQPEPDARRRGEIIFHDATKAFQRWHSCASCHPNDGRVDGLRWDFLGDGIGNAKDTISLLYFDKTEPQNRRATVPTAKQCARNGLEGTNMLVATDQDVDDLYTYLTSLRAEPSPHLTADGKLTEAAARGKTLFEEQAGCARCHPGPYFTDRKMHNVGVLSDNEPDGRYDTPSLIEAWRTAPYLHDGRALTLKDVLSAHNESGRHGNVRELSPQQVEDIVAYLLSL
ncbi:MAG: beta-propeller fold lactonase family protein [Pirellulales bacterium]